MASADPDEQGADRDGARDIGLVGGISGISGSTPIPIPCGG